MTKELRAIKEASRIDAEIAEERSEPNAETIAALNEYSEMKAHPEKYRRYSSFREAMDDISAEDRPNKETIAAMLEAERIAHDPSVKKYTNLDEMFAELKK